MINILVPTDFSPLSKVAVKFAIKASSKMDGAVTLLHVFSMVEPTRHSMREKYEALEKELNNYAKEDFKAIIQDVEKFNKTTNPIAYKIEKGLSFNDTVRNIAKKSKSDLIVMGTKGASGLQKYVLGSNAASVIEISPIPVLVVPEEADFKGFRNVVYATDLTTIDKDMKALIPYVKMFNANLHVLHVATGKNAEAAKARINEALKMVDYKKITVAVMPGKAVEKVIEGYVADIKADLIALFTTDKTVYEKMFDKSITRRMTFQTHTPLIAFKH